MDHCMSQTHFQQCISECRNCAAVVRQRGQCQGAPPAKLKADELAAPKAGVPPKRLGALELAAPNAGVLAAPKAGVLEPPNPNAELLAPPNAGVETAPPPKAGVLKPPKRDGVLAGWLCPACVRAPLLSHLCK